MQLAQWVTLGRVHWRQISIFSLSVFALSWLT